MAQVIGRNIEMLSKLSAIVLSLAVLPILGQYVHDGECRSDVEVVQNFDLDKVKGNFQ